MISYILGVNLSPKDVTSDNEHQYSEDTNDDIESDKDESSSEGEEAESSPSYEAHKEPRSKVLHDPSVKAGEVQQLTASGQTTHSSKCVRIGAESSAEKQPKQPK